MVSPHRTNPNCSQSILLAVDQGNSLTALVSKGNVEKVTYTAYGYSHADLQPSTQLGFNGQLREPHTHWYILGNGYRAYNPVLMRFHSPDNLSPFGAGGLNPYVYCAADPINQHDPTGHFIVSWIASKLLAALGGSSSAGGMFLSILSRGRFSAQGGSALAVGGAGALLGAAAFAYPASVAAPFLAGSSVAAGVASVTLGYRAGRATGVRGIQRVQSIARLRTDPPPAYSPRLQETPAPSYSNLSLPPPYSPRVPHSYAPTRATRTPAIELTAASSISPVDQAPLLNSVELATVRLGHLPEVEYIDEISSINGLIRTS